LCEKKLTNTVWKCINHVNTKDWDQ